MPRLIIAPARSPAEAADALALAVRVFSENSKDQSYPDFKTALWLDDPYYQPENVLLARLQSGRLIGLIRVVPRALYRADQKFVVAGISSVAIDPDFRGQGHSSTMMEYAIDECRQRGFDLSLLIARRAADHYYTRFGFWGISSYNKAVIALSNPAPEGPAITLLPAKSEHAAMYAEAYLACYSKSFGYFERTAQYWNFLINTRARLFDSSWTTIAADTVPVGYLVRSNNAIHEIAWSGDLSANSLIAALTTQLQLPQSAGALMLEISPRHRLVTQIEGMDITVTSRECPYGGHMVKILDIHKTCEMLARRAERRLRKIGASGFREDRRGLSLSYDGAVCRVNLTECDSSCLSYQQTCDLLGASTFSLEPLESDLSQPFNISLPDQL